MSEQTREIIKTIWTQWKIRIDPNQLMSEEEQQALLKAEEERQRIEKHQRRMEALHAPKRLILGHSALDRSGTWGEKLNKLKPQIGTGTLLVFQGPSGTGKSQMALELALYAITVKELTARFITFLELQLNLKNAFGKDGGEQDIIQRMVRPDLLIIDEFDWVPVRRERVTDDYWQGILYHIINHRYGDMKDTLLTSNQSAEEFEQSTLAPIKSRIMETGGVINTEGWRDWRNQKTQRI